MGEQVCGMVKSGIPLTRATGLALVSDTPKGRGVFATQSIPARTVLEVSPVLVLPLSDTKHHIPNTQLQHYTYNWPTTDPSTGRTITTQAVVLGLGSMFNHSTLKQNVVWRRDLTAQCVVYSTLRDIEAGEELCISYGRLWFRDADTEVLDEDEGDGLGLLGSIDL